MQSVLSRINFVLWSRDRTHRKEHAICIFFCSVTDAIGSTVRPWLPCLFHNRRRYIGSARDLNILRSLNEDFFGVLTAEANGIWATVLWNNTSRRRLFQIEDNTFSVEPDIRFEILLCRDWRTMVKKLHTGRVNRNLVTRSYALCIHARDFFSSFI